MWADMNRKKHRRETPPTSGAAMPLCRYEELAMRENQLRRARTEKPVRGD